MNRHFVTRGRCPACDHCSTSLLFSREYQEPRLRVALENFYAHVGRLDYNALLGAEFIIQSCQNCGLLFQREVPDNFLLSKLYEEWISPEKARARFHLTESKARQLELQYEVKVSLMLANANPRLSRLLDYGCGWGEWARAAQSFGFEVWGTELSASRRAACEQAGIKVVADFALPDAYFDVISADQVFEHLPNPSDTLVLLKSKLRQGGVVRIAVPNGLHTQDALKNFDRELRRPRLGRINPIAPLEHLNCFRTSSLVHLAGRAGLVRVIPNWGILRSAFVWPPGLKGKMKQTIMPFYLRSRWTTQLWFSDASAS
jgi:SAM-dependent methyltransferase